MENLGSIWPLLLALVAVAAVMYLAYLFSRYLAVGAAKINKSKHIKIIDKVVLGQDKMIFIAIIGKRYYLIGSSTESINILTELDEENLAEEISQSAKAPESGGFQNVLNAILLKKERKAE